MFLKNSRRLRCSLSVQESLAEVSMSQMSACTLKKVISVTNIKAPATTNQMFKITHTNNEADYKDQNNNRNKCDGMQAGIRYLRQPNDGMKQRLLQHPQQCIKRSVSQSRSL